MHVIKSVQNYYEMVYEINHYIYTNLITIDVQDVVTKVNCVMDIRLLFSMSCLH